jgi:hypothetical protein
MPSEPDPNSLSRAQLFFKIASTIATIFGVFKFVVEASGAKAPSAADFLGYAGTAGAGALIGMWAGALLVLGAAALTGTLDKLDFEANADVINSVTGGVGATIAILDAGADPHDPFFRLLGVAVLGTCAYYLLFRRLHIS